MTQTIQAPAQMWKAGDDVMNTVTDLIAKYHPDLVLCDEEIAVVFKEKASQVGDVVIAGKTAKAPKLLGILGEVDYKFVITLGADEWQSLSDKQRVALLDHHLCACGVEENPKTGSTRFYVRIPDVAFFKDEVERHGFWRTSGASASQDYISDLFGEDDNP
jgi:hypothetical protein